MMYYDFGLQRKQKKEVFMNYKNFNTEELLHRTQSDVLIKQIKTLKINLNLCRAFIMILCESIYDQKLNDQISKRTHRFDQQRIMTYCIFRNDTVIKELIEQKRKNKSDFEKRIFIKIQKKNEKNVIAENNVGTDFIKKISTVMSKII